MEKIKELKGLTLYKIIKSSDFMAFYSNCNRKFIMLHHDDCCESVFIEDIVGDLEDLIGSPITMSEEVLSDDPPRDDFYYESYTWTYYKFATLKGYVTIRWFGTSNGYYSENVDFEEVF